MPGTKPLQRPGQMEAAGAAEVLASTVLSTIGLQSVVTLNCLWDCPGLVSQCLSPRQPIKVQRLEVDLVLLLNTCPESWSPRDISTEPIRHIIMEPGQTNCALLSLGPESLPLAHASCGHFTSMGKKRSDQARFSQSQHQWHCAILMWG